MQKIPIKLKPGATPNEIEVHVGDDWVRFVYEEKDLENKMERFLMKVGMATEKLLEIHLSKSHGN